MAEDVARSQIIFFDRLSRRTKTILTIAIVAIVGGAILQRLIAETPEQRAAKACIEQYNRYVHQAKSDLVMGNRIGAINSLTAARAQMGVCEIASASSVSGIWHH
jgi:hypothetical protein